MSILKRAVKVAKKQEGGPLYELQGEISVIQSQVRKNLQVLHSLNCPKLNFELRAGYELTFNTFRISSSKVSYIYLLWLRFNPLV